MAKALLTATFLLSETDSTAAAADVVAEVACRLTGADGAHLYLPDLLGGTVWSNVNAVRAAADPGTLTFDVSRDVPDLDDALLRGTDLFVADGLAADCDRRPLRQRHSMASLLYLPLLDLGMLVLWWHQPQPHAPVLSDDIRSFLVQGAQALRRRLEATTLRDLTVSDPLTGLVNRRGLLDVLEDLRPGAGLLLLDLDHFKRVNDTLGHRHGDQVLQDFAVMLGQSGEGAECVARWGGEEFAVVLPSDGARAGAQLYAQLRTRWGQRGMTFSAGLAVHRAGARAEETFEAADRALYEAKRTGRNRLVHAPEVAWEPSSGPRVAVPAPRAPTPEAVELTLAQLDAALDGGLAHPHYQPVVDTRTGAVVAVEALARLTHPDTGALLVPDQFLPLAERTGRIRRVDSLVGDIAMRDVAGWRAAGYDLCVGINVSVDHLDDPQLASRLLDRCAAHGLDVDALIVEVTETLQSLTGRGHSRTLQQLRDAGVNVTLDDFGTGFSTMSYLLRFPVAGVKIDRTFTAALGTERGRHVVQGILTIARSLGVHAVAEGVETPAQLAWLTEHGCPFAQGYLLSRPVPGEVLLDAVDVLTARARVAVLSAGT